MKLFDAVVVGGGPAGLTAVLYLVRSGCSVALVEKLTPGGQVLLTESIENYPGFPQGVKGWDLAEAFAAHIADLPVARFSETVETVERAPEGFRVKAGQESLLGRTVIVCSGADHKLLGLPNETALKGRGVSYCAICDGNFFRGQEVAVVGGGNTALEESLYLSKIVKKVYLIHRRETFRGAKTYLERLQNLPEKVEIIRNTVVAAIHGETKLDGLTLRHAQTAKESYLPVEGLFVFVGYEPAACFLPAEVQKDVAGFIVTDTEMNATVPGIFAAGDIRSKQCRQVSTAVGDGATAAQAAFLYLEQLHA